jgi:hypothetical protein
MHIDLLLLKLSLFPQQILGIAARPEGVDMRVLEQQQRGRNLASGNFSGEFVLQIPGLFVFDEAEGKDLA